jgi:hypothetical protein
MPAQPAAASTALRKEKIHDGSGYAVQIAVGAVLQLFSTVSSYPYVVPGTYRTTCCHPTGTTTISTSLVGAPCVSTGTVVSFMKNSFPAPFSILTDME